MHPTYTTIKRRVMTSFSIVSLLSTILVPLALAVPNGGSGSQRGCIVVNSDTNTTSTVPHGTRIGLFYCYDGDWKFGTVILDNLLGEINQGPLTGPLTGVFTLDGPLPVPTQMLQDTLPEQDEPQPPEQDEPQSPPNCPRCQPL